jgi:hypothetical protein
MTTRLLVVAAASAAALAFAATAQAETLLFSYAEAGGINFSFEQSSTPTPITFTSGVDTVTSVADWSGSVGPYTSIAWYNFSNNGMFDTSDGKYVIFGPQVYTGTEGNPVFAPGVFTGQDLTDRETGTLTITDIASGGVPEPAAWALMLVGFATTGVAFRASRKTLATA